MRLGIERCSFTVQTLALSRSSAGEIGRAAVKAGMTRIRADGLKKAARGVTTIEEILRTTVWDRAARTRGKY